jgi:hypothetical protein
MIWSGFALLTHVFLGHVTLSGVPILIFGSISLVLYIYTFVMRLFGIDIIRNRNAAYATAKGLDDDEMDDVAWKAVPAKAALHANGKKGN